MNISHTLSKTFVRALPTDVGLWRILSYLPAIDRCEHPIEVHLRSFPLRMKIRPYTYIGRFLYYRGMYEESQVKTLVKLLKPGQVFVDVGANIGIYSLVSALTVGKTGRVIAIEPQKSARAELETNLALNNFSNIDIYPVAVARYQSELELFQVSSNNDGQATTRLTAQERSIGQVEKVQALSLDEIMMRSGVGAVHGVKIDVEGGELEALWGFENTLTSKPPAFIFLECIEKHLERFGHSRAELIDFLRRHDYAVMCLYRGKWWQIKDVAHHDQLHASSDFLGLHTTAPHLFAAIQPKARA
jgi:FkbM family methyltransferase